MGLWSRKKKKKGAARAEAENAAGNMVAWPDATQPARMSPQAPPGATTQRGNASGAKRLTQAAPSAAATRPSPVSPASASIFAASLPAPLRDIKPTMAANAAELKPSRAPGEDLAERFATRHPPESSQLMKATLMRQARQKRASTWDTVDDDGDLVVDKPMTTAREVCTEAAAPRGAALTVSTCANGVQTLKSASGEDALSGKPVDAASKTPAALVAPAAAAVEGTPGREQASISTPMSGDAWVHDYELEDDLLDLRGYDTKDEAAGETAGETASESADEYAQEHAFLNQENVASAAKKDTGHMEGAKHSANWVVADAAMQQAVSTESASSSTTTTTPRATAVDIVTRAEQELRAAIHSGWFLPVNPERLERAIKAAQAQGVCGDLCAQAGDVLQEERRLRAEVEARLRKAKAARATARAAAKAEASVRLQEKMAAKTANLSHVGTTTSTDAGSLSAAKAPSPLTLPNEAMGAPAAAVLSSKASARTSELTLNQVGNASAEALNRVHKHISFSQQCIWFLALHAAALLFTYISDMPQFVAALDMIDRSLVFMRDGMANCALITWRALPPLFQLLPALDMALLLGL